MDSFLPIAIFQNSNILYCAVTMRRLLFCLSFDSSGILHKNDKCNLCNSPKSKKIPNTPCNLPHFAVLYACYTVSISIHTRKLRKFQNHGGTPT